MSQHGFTYTVSQLKRAATIKEQIERLNKELRAVLGPPAKSRTASTKNWTMSASVKKKIAATQKARWAKLRRTKPATGSAKPAAKKKTMSPAAARAKLSAKLKAYWAAKKAGKK